jgi:hypothetical protein
MPAEIAAQNRRRSSRPATGGRPGDDNGARPDRSERRFRMFIATSSVKVLRRPLESAQYVAIKYTERLAEAGIEPLVGSVGDSYDNALAEIINGLYKAEVIHRCGPWRSFEAVEFATLEWVDWLTIDVSWNPSVTSRPPKLSNDITPGWNSPKSPPDLTKSASGKPGAVQRHPGRDR